MLIQNIEIQGDKYNVGENVNKVEKKIETEKNQTGLSIKITIKPLLTKTLSMCAQ